MRIETADQGSGEWIRSRRGRLTASRMAEVMDRPAINRVACPSCGAKLLKPKEVLLCPECGFARESAARFNYKWETVIERITGHVGQHYVSPDMEYGTSGETPARREYELRINDDVATVGFVLHPTMDFVGASPDFLVGTDGMGEIKVPRLAKHMKWLAAGILPEEYLHQCMAGMNCCERSWCDFISYSPPDPDDEQRLYLPRDLQMFRFRVERDDALIADMDAESVRFNDEVEEIVEKLKKLCNGEEFAPITSALKDQLRASALPRAEDGEVDLSRLADQLQGEPTP